jgi:hypothetical protein
VDHWEEHKNNPMQYKKSQKGSIRNKTSRRYPRWHIWNRFSGDIDEPIYSLIDSINKSMAYVLSNDIPSGVDADTGKVSTICVRANYLIVLHMPKKWMKVKSLPPSKYSIESIGIPYHKITSNYKNTI